MTKKLDGYESNHQLRAEMAGVILGCADFLKDGITQQRAEIVCRNILEAAQEYRTRLWPSGENHGPMSDVVSQVVKSGCEYEMGESTYGAGDSLPCGREADESGFCQKHRGLV